MKKILNSFFAAAILLLSSNIATAADHDICLLSDMSGDSDDIAALQMALYYHHTDQINLRCVITSSKNGRGHLVSRYMVEWWGYTINDIPVGENKTNGSNDPIEADQNWVDDFITEYGLSNFNAQHGANLLNQKISQYPNMTVIEIGPAVITYHANARDRIKKYVQMAGRSSSNLIEYNSHAFHPGIKYVAQRSQVEWYDFYLGAAMVTGQSTVFNGSHPVRFANETRNENLGINVQGGNKSYDMLAVLGAVTGTRYFNFQSGTFDFSSNPSSGDWQAGNGTHRLAAYKDFNGAQNEINRIISLYPSDVTSMRRNNNSADIIPILEYYLKKRKN